jgi:cyclopropane-fatty-acyl-phospholipid synthase
MPKRSIMSKYRDLLQSMAAQAGIRINGPEPHDPQVNNESFYERVVSEGSLGLGESYMDGWWQCAQLDEFFFRILRTWGDHKLDLNWRQTLALIQAKLRNQQSKRKAVEVAEAHYNLSNAFFEGMLDKRMIYSCGYWKGASTLEQAQENKLDLICRKLDLTAQDQVLDIGCGYGGFLKFAWERYRCRGVGITNSERQAAYARANCAGTPVEIITGDYRDLNPLEQGEFKKVVSVGMFEHVGPKNYRTFMEVVNGVLAMGGLFLLHSIGNNISRLRGDPWMQTYVFPYGVVPSIQQIGRAIEGLFVMEDWHNFGVDYARTLLSWLDNFKRNCRHLALNTALPQDRFNRMWEYYLSSCAGAFRARHLQLWQIVLSKGGSPFGYQSIR